VTAVVVKCHLLLVSSAPRHLDHHDFSSSCIPLLFFSLDQEPAWQLTLLSLSTFLLPPLQLVVFICSLASRTSIHPGVVSDSGIHLFVLPSFILALSSLFCVSTSPPSSSPSFHPAVVVAAHPIISDSRDCTCSQIFRGFCAVGGFRCVHLFVVAHLMSRTSTSRDYHSCGLHRGCLAVRRPQCQHSLLTEFLAPVHFVCALLEGGITDISQFR
jgi:hypothetical protein